MKTLASVATLPSRERALAQMLESVEGQFDRIEVQDGSIAGDAAKFEPHFSLSGFEYRFTLDDDLIYPPDYARSLIDAIERHGRACLVSAHGRSFERYPIRSYYSPEATIHRCLESVHDEVKVDFPGTGTMAWHDSTVTFKENDFRRGRNMADVHVGVRLRRSGIRAVVVPHHSGWIRHSPHVDLSETIWAWARNDDGRQTRLVNEAWTGSPRRRRWWSFWPFK